MLKPRNIQSPALCSHSSTQKISFLPNTSPKILLHGSPTWRSASPILTMLVRLHRIPSPSAMFRAMTSQSQRLSPNTTLNMALVCSACHKLMYHTLTDSLTAFPLLWIFGACIICSPLRVEEFADSALKWLPGKTEGEKSLVLQRLRQAELKWAWRCFWACVTLLCLLIAAAFVALRVLASRHT